MNTVRAKFHVNSVKKVDNGQGWKSEEIQASPVMGTKWNPETGRNEPDNENARFYRATPSGSFSMTIDNPEAFGFFKAGCDYYFDFTEATVAAAAGATAEE